MQRIDFENLFAFNGKFTLCVQFVLMQQRPGVYKSRLPCRKRACDNFSIKIKRGFKFIVICMKMRQMMFVVITPIHFYQNSIKHFSGVSASNLSFRRSGCSGFRYRSSLLTSLRSVAVAASRPYHPSRNRANLSLDGLLLCHCRA